MQKNNRGYFYAALAIFFWASAAAVAKLVLNNIDGFQVTLFNTLIASIVLFIIILFQGKIKILKLYSPKDWVKLSLLGLLGIFAYYVLYYSAIKFSSAQEANVLNYSWPLWIVILSIPILKEKLTFKKILAIVLGFIGVYIVVTKGSLLNLPVGHIKGDVLALVGAILYGLFSVLTKKQSYEKYTASFIYFLVTFIFTFIWVLTFSYIPHLNLHQWLGILWLGCLPSGLAITFWTLALENGDTSILSNLVFLTPLLSLVYIYFLVGEKIYISSIVGLAFIVIGILVQSSKST